MELGYNPMGGTLRNTAIPTQPLPQFLAADKSLKSRWNDDPDCEATVNFLQVLHGSPLVLWPGLSPVL